jgi:hypothetical protein
MSIDASSPKKKRAKQPISARENPISPKKQRIVGASGKQVLILAHSISQFQPPQRFRARRKRATLGVERLDDQDKLVLIVTFSLDASPPGQPGEVYAFQGDYTFIINSLSFLISIFFIHYQFRLFPN